MSATTPITRVCAALLVESVERAVGTEEVGAYTGERVFKISICDYLKRWTKFTETGDEEVACAMVFINRLLATGRTAITQQTVHRIAAVAMLAATKWREERPFKMSIYARVAGVSVEELAALEIEFLNDIEWAVHVEPTELAEFLDGLRHRSEWDADASGAAAIAASLRARKMAAAAAGNVEEAMRFHTLLRNQQRADADRLSSAASSPVSSFSSSFMGVAGATSVAAVAAMRG